MIVWRQQGTVELGKAAWKNRRMLSPSTTVRSKNACVHVISTLIDTPSMSPHTRGPREKLRKHSVARGFSRDGFEKINVNCPVVAEAEVVA